MTCPNCGLNNPDNAKFCGNCGTTLTPGAPGPSPQPPAYQPPPPYQAPYQPGPYPAAPPPQGNTAMKNVALGCLIVILIFLFFGLSCTRACFRPRRYFRYGSVSRHSIALVCGERQQSGSQLPRNLGRA